MNRASWTILCTVALAACSNSQNKPGGGGGSTGSAGTTGAAGVAQAGETGAAGSSAGGSSAGGSSAGATGSAGAGATGGSGGGAAGAAAGSTGAAGASADAGAKDAPTGEVAGPTTTAGCANHNYPLCIDFENGIDTTVWTGGNVNAIETTEVAHGTHAYRLYSNVAATPKGGVLTTTKLGTLKDQIWGRFYIHFKPGAPGNHGNIVGGYDQAGNWYEIGWQFDAILGVWHGGGGERPTASTPVLVDQWYCVELFFDGTKTNMPQWWVDGPEAQYWNLRNPTLIPKVVTQFMKLTVGWTPYSGLELKMPDGHGDQTETRILSDAWIDDIAFDTQRIGCIQ